MAWCNYQLFCAFANTQRLWAKHCPAQSTNAQGHTHNTITHTTHTHTKHTPSFSSQSLGGTCRAQYPGSPPPRAPPPRAAALEPPRALPFPFLPASSPSAGCWGFDAKLVTPKLPCCCCCCTQEIQNPFIPPLHTRQRCVIMLTSCYLSTPAKRTLVHSPAAAAPPSP